MAGRTAVVAIVFVVIVIGISESFPDRPLPKNGILSRVKGLIKNLFHGQCGTESQKVCSTTQDIIIVGGGPGGTYAGWRLKSDASHRNDSMLLLEATNRIGGRLLSVHMPNVDFTVAEAGGMRYVPEDHPLLAEVIAEFDIPTKVFEMDEENEDRPYGFRDLVFQQKDLTTADLPYVFTPAEKHKVPDDVEILYYNLTVDDIERNKPSDQIITVYGDPLLNYGMRTAFNLAGSSQDAGSYVIAGSGYNDVETNTNAAVFMYGSGDGSETAQSDYLTPVEGMQTVPESLAQGFKDLGGVIEENTTVTAIAKYSSDLYVISTRNSVTGVTETKCARKVILSLTRSQLLRINWDGIHHSLNSHLIDSVFSEKALKFFFTFEQAFWTKPDLAHFNLTRGRTLSSLPTRNTFYFTPENDSSDALLMCYCDGPNAVFWGDNALDVLPRHEGPDFYFPMPQALVDEGLRQLAINHNTTKEIIGTPKSALLMYWNHELSPKDIPNVGPFMPSEAWHMWKAGYNFTKITHTMLRLDPDQEVYTIGEAYSLNQGWIEGAFETAVDMLDTYFFNDGLSERKRHKRSPRRRLFP
eukprot:m.13341 g.13341  ORF g.13341 m.13341 type:complete len:582 (+) comp24697_c0_seq1:94-1839(+)